MLLAAVSDALARDNRPRAMIVVMDNADDAQYMYSDLHTLTDPVWYFPSSRRRRQAAEDEAMAIQRTEVLTALAAAACANPIVVTYPEALEEPVPDKGRLQQHTLTVSVGQTCPLSVLCEQMSAWGFRRVDFVYEPGQYAVRGGIVDVYGYAHDNPYRLDYFGDEVESIREFDIESQLSQDKVEAIDIVASASLDAAEGTLADYTDSATLWVSNDWSLVAYKLPAIREVVEEGVATLEIGTKSTFPTCDTLQFDTLPQPAFNKNFDLLIQDLQARMAEGYRIYILADQAKQTDRLQAIFEDKDTAIRFLPTDHTLHEGFVDRGAKICCYTDHQIFERYHRVSMQSENARRGKAILTLKEINQLQIGDYVVHTDHGIGRFAGLVTTHFNGRPQETIKLTYRDGDTLFVSIHNLHRIAKYKGREGTEPTISRLGSGAWERMKERTKEKVKDIARDLIRLYATRKQQQGFAYSPDGYMQHELEASFLYEDTPDQAKATLDIKHDMESPMPMDRLVCGDVGFGKTEVAMRAAFKAATDGKQVAVLVPTTVLALQHYNTFRERFKDFPVRVEYLSRGKSPQEVKAILEALQNGSIDILIGTHKLVGKQVVWKDLGLLIIDEEQKFGVAVKEKLKSLRTNIDVLTLTATPIPHTLQFSLLGARDLSIITTPPPNRYPVQTELLTPADEDILKEAITLEMERNGQVYVVCNRIEMLPRIENRIRRLCPEARRRLDALATFAELGAGFNLAMQDLDIRGAGNMLGSEQSGFIADLGYDTYQRILNEAMLELKDEVGMDVAAAIGKTVGGNNGDNWCVDSQLESDLDLCFPESYIENISERITLYRELDSLSNEDSLLAYQKRLIDRFGVLPPAAEQLLNVVRLRWLCCSMGIEKVILKQGHLTLFFVRNNEAYWQSDIFGRVLQYVCSRPQRCRLQEERDKTGKPTRRRSVTIQQVTTITGALTLLRTIQTSSPAL